MSKLIEFIKNLFKLFSVKNNDKGEDEKMDIGKNRIESISDNGIKLLAKYEFLKLYPYDDQYPKKKLLEWHKRATIGYGHLILKKEWDKYKNKITKSEALELKHKDISKYDKLITRLVTVELNQNQFDALVILSYNIGPRGFKNSTVLKMINNPEYKSNIYNNLEEAWKAWNKDVIKGVKQVSKGLVSRRKKEWKLYRRI